MQAILSTSLGLGLLSGLLAGLFGIGGGLVIVPVLVMLFQAQGFPANAIMLMAVATSLAAIIITALASTLSHHRLGALIWSKVFRLAPGILLGAGMGALIAERMPTKMLKTIFIIYLLYAGIELARATPPKTSALKPSGIIDLGMSLVIGLISALVGIGGGTMTVPYLVKTRYPIRNAVAISSACGLPIALAGTASYSLLGHHADSLPPFSFGYVYLPSFIAVSTGSMLTAPVGAKLANRLPAKKLKRYFSALIFLIAAKMAWH